MISCSKFKFFLKFSFSIKSNDDASYQSSERGCVDNATQTLRSSLKSCLPNSKQRFSSVFQTNHWNSSVSWAINLKVSFTKAFISPKISETKWKFPILIHHRFGFPPSSKVYLWVTLGPKSQNPISNFLSNPKFQFTKNSSKFVYILTE